MNLVVIMIHMAYRQGKAWGSHYFPIWGTTSIQKCIYVGNNITQIAKAFKDLYNEDFQNCNRQNQIVNGTRKSYISYDVFLINAII